MQQSRHDHSTMHTYLNLHTKCPVIEDGESQASEIKLMKLIMCTAAITPSSRCIGMLPSEDPLTSSQANSKVSSYCYCHKSHSYNFHAFLVTAYNTTSLTNFGSVISAFSYLVFTYVAFLFPTIYVHTSLSYTSQ